MIQIGNYIVSVEDVKIRTTAHIGKRCWLVWFKRRKRKTSRFANRMIYYILTKPNYLPRNLESCKLYLARNAEFTTMTFQRLKCFLNPWNFSKIFETFLKLLNSLKFENVSGHFRSSLKALRSYETSEIIKIFVKQRKLSKLSRNVEEIFFHISAIYRVYY